MPSTPPAPPPLQHSSLAPYDGVLLLSFGGPERPQDVLPFLRNVTAGRDIPQARLDEVAKHYDAVGGKSPINDQNRALLAALRAELVARGVCAPVVWGNRNFAPYLTDALRAAHDDGMTRLVTVMTSAYSSYSSCRQYRENLAAAVATLADEGRTVVVDKVRPYVNHPGFAGTYRRLVTEAVRDRAGGQPDHAVRLVFVTHSVPEAMNDTSGPAASSGGAYRRQHQALARYVADGANAALGRRLDHDLVYCSRSGPPAQPWLEPDVNDYLKSMAGDGVELAVVVPLGFVSDHMEVVHDLDVEAAETAAEVGIRMVRVPTVGVDPQFVSGLVDLVLERAAQARGEAPPALAVTDEPALPSTCAVGCCPNPRRSLPALCGADS